MEDITKCGDIHADWAKNFTAALPILCWQQSKAKWRNHLLLTGDIPAMVKRLYCTSSSLFSDCKEDEELADMISGLVKSNFYINIDPYANAFNEEANGAGHQTDHTKWTIGSGKENMKLILYATQYSWPIFFTKYRKNWSIQSIFYWRYQNLGRVQTEQIMNTLLIHLYETRQERRYADQWRARCKTAFTGMTWSGFRPSDDTCRYGYLVPSNMFAVVVLGYVEEIFKRYSMIKKLYSKHRNWRKRSKRGFRITDERLIKRANDLCIWSRWNGKRHSHGWQ